MDLRNFALLTLAAAFWAAPARADREWYPEFQSLTEAEEAIFERSGRINPEYSSDVLAYTKEFSWEYDWLTHRKGLDLSVGSVSASHFLMDQRLKVHADLTDWLEFRFHWVDERNLERDSEHTVLELIYWPRTSLFAGRKWVGFSFYGEPEMYKRGDDTGVALFLKPTDTHEIRFFQTFIDVTRIKRNDRTDTFVQPEIPYSRGIVGRWWADPSSGTRDFVEYAVRWETRTRWLFPDDNYEYQYWKGFGQLFFDKKLTDWVRLNGRFMYDRKLESKRATGTPSEVASDTAYRTDRFFALARTVFPRVGPWDWELATGVEYAYRRWDGPFGPAVFRDYLPHFWLTIPAFGTEPSRGSFLVGMDASWHRGMTPEGERTWFDEDVSVDGRLNLGYTFRFGEQAQLKLMATGDVDKLLTRDAWEGGNGQFQLFF